MTERANVNNTARLATLDQLIETTLPNFIAPIPSRDTLRSWFDSAKIPRFKANPTARRGGGPVFYSVAAVEKFLRSRTLPAQ
jgi:hypothetical protein